MTVAMLLQRFVRMDGGLSSLDKEGSIYIVLNDSLKLDTADLRVLAAILQRPNVASRVISLDLRCILAPCLCPFGHPPPTCLALNVASRTWPTNPSIIRRAWCSSCQFEDEGCIALAPAIKNLSTLQYLHLGCAVCARVILASIQPQPAAQTLAAYSRLAARHQQRRCAAAAVTGEVRLSPVRQGQPGDGRGVHRRRQRPRRHQGPAQARPIVSWRARRARSRTAATAACKHGPAAHKHRMTAVIDPGQCERPNTTILFNAACVCSSRTPTRANARGSKT